MTSSATILDYLPMGCYCNLGVRVLLYCNLIVCVYVLYEWVCREVIVYLDVCRCVCVFVCVYVIAWFAGHTLHSRTVILCR